MKKEKGSDEIRFIAVAADIGTVDCSKINSAFNRIKTGCECTQAAVAFGAFSWYLQFI